MEKTSLTLPKDSTYPPEHDAPDNKSAPATPIDTPLTAFGTISYSQAAEGSSCSLSKLSISEPQSPAVPQPSAEQEFVEEASATLKKKKKKKKQPEQVPLTEVMNEGIIAPQPPKKELGARPKESQNKTKTPPEDISTTSETQQEKPIEGTGKKKKKKKIKEKMQEDVQPEPLGTSGMCKSFTHKPEYSPEDEAVITIPNEALLLKVQKFGSLKGPLLPLYESLNCFGTRLFELIELVGSAGFLRQLERKKTMVGRIVPEMVSKLNELKQIALDIDSANHKEHIITKHAQRVIKLSAPLLECFTKTVEDNLDNVGKRGHKSSDMAIIKLKDMLQELCSSVYLLWSFLKATSDNVCVVVRLEDLKEANQ